MTLGSGKAMVNVDTLIIGPEIIVCKLTRKMFLRFSPENFGP
jgi:hypothetical protein